MDPRDLNRFSEIRKNLANLARNHNAQAIFNHNAWAIEAAKKNLARYERIQVQSIQVQRFLQSIQTPKAIEAFSNLTIPSTTLRELETARFPVANFNPSATLDVDRLKPLSRAVSNSTLTYYWPQQVQDSLQNAVSSLPQDLDQVALASANFAALNRIRPSLEAMSRLPVDEILSQYQVALGNASRLLRDENIRHLLRSATSEDLVEEGIESAASVAEMEVSTEDLSLGFDFQNFDLTQFLHLDNLIINLSKCIVVLSVASVMASQSIAFTHYEQGINDTLKVMVAVQAAACIARGEQNKDSQDAKD